MLKEYRLHNIWPVNVYRLGKDWEKRDNEKGVVGEGGRRQRVC